MSTSCISVHQDRSIIDLATPRLEKDTQLFLRLSKACGDVKHAGVIFVHCHIKESLGATSMMADRKTSYGRQTQCLMSCCLNCSTVSRSIRASPPSWVRYMEVGILRHAGITPPFLRTRGGRYDRERDKCSYPIPPTACVVSFHQCLTGTRHPRFLRSIRHQRFHSPRSSSRSARAIRFDTLNIATSPKKKYRGARIDTDVSFLPLTFIGEYPRKI
jgi:hypothetical protein